MPPGQSPEAIDTRLIFRVYTWIAAAGGASAFMLAVLMARDGSGGLAATTGLVGAMSIALAAYGAAFARVEDPVGRLGGLKAFSAAHLIAGVFLWVLAQWIRGAAPPLSGDAASTIFAFVPYRLLASNLFITGAVLLYLAYTATAGPRFTATVRSTTLAADGRQRVFALREKEGAASTRRLRSQYEEQIRHAARQEERARLARDLHDAVKQQLFVVQTAAATVQARFDADPGGAKEAVDRVRVAAREAITEMEAMLDQLQAAPIENIGLVEALKKQCEALGFRTGAVVTFDPEALPPAHLLPPGAQQAIFRVVQEALANIGRHARAGHVTARLGVHRRSLVLEVIDDGAGFDPMSGQGMGIRNMQARAHEVGGHFELASTPGAGTTVSVSVPFVARSSRSYLLMAVAFASALVACAVLIARGNGLRAWWIGAGWIAAIGTVRYLLAFYRVRRAGREAASS